MSALPSADPRVSHCTDVGLSSWSTPRAGHAGGAVLPQDARRREARVVVGPADDDHAVVARVADRRCCRLGARPRTWASSSRSTPLPATPVVPYCQRRPPLRPDDDHALRVAVDDEVGPVVEPPGAHGRLQLGVLCASCTPRRPGRRCPGAGPGGWRRRRRARRRPASTWTPRGIGIGDALSDVAVGAGAPRRDDAGLHPQVLAEAGGLSRRRRGWTARGRTDDRRRR